MNKNDLLIDMAKTGNTEAVKYALDHGADVHAYDNYALRYASSYGHTETVKLLLNHGANVNAYDNCALKWASQNDQTETVKLLLDHGADAEVLKSYNEWTKRYK